MWKKSIKLIIIIKRLPLFRISSMMVPARFIACGLITAQVQLSLLNEVPLNFPDLKNKSNSLEINENKKNVVGYVYIFTLLPNLDQPRHA